MNMLLLIGVMTWHVTSSNVVAVQLEPLYDVTQSVTTFSNNLFKSIAKDEPGNVVCSPISAAMVLLMITFGAGGYTKQQLRSAFNLPSNDTLVTTSISSLIDNFDEFTNVELRLINKIYIAKDFKPKNEFTRMIKNVFRSEVESVDFQNAATTSKTINYWCRARTNSRITNLITANDLDGNTALVLVNAAYFKGNWESKFDGADTKLRPFRSNKFTIEPVWTMHQSGTFYWGKLPKVDATFVVLPYESKHYRKRISMYIILPNEIDGIHKLKNNLEKLTIEDLWSNSDSVKNVSVYLPKFKVESTIDLQWPLDKLGLDDMFTDAANFTEICDDRPLKVSQFIQKSFIEVNEEGSEGAAATVGGIENKIWNNVPTYVNFVADHPFLCMIITDSGVSLFSAIIFHPTSGEITRPPLGQQQGSSTFIPNDLRDGLIFQ